MSRQPLIRRGRAVQRLPALAAVDQEFEMIRDVPPELSQAPEPSKPNGLDAR